MRFNLAKFWREERLGLMMILASGIVIATAVFLLLDSASQTRLEQIRSSGSSISRILADMPLSRLQSQEQDNGPLRIVQLGQDSRDFAYAIVVDAKGNIISAANNSSVDISGLRNSLSHVLWSGERELQLPGRDEKLIEFFSPVVDGGDIAGTVRVGYFVPQPGLQADQLPIAATMALVIFLLTPLFYFMVRREIQPIQAINEEISSRLDDGAFNACQIEATGELAEFINRFNEFSDLMRARVNALEHDNSSLVASQKLLGYRKHRIESVLQALPEAILVLNEDGRVSFANRNVGAILGVEPNDIMNRTPSEWCLHAEALEVLKQFEMAASNQNFADTMKISGTTTEVKQLSIKAYPLFAPQDPSTKLGKMILIRDISKEVMAEQGRAEFVAHVSHELKTPLNTLALYSEALLGEQGDDKSFRVEACNVIHDEAQRLAALVDNLLNLTRIETGNLVIDKQRVRLQDLLKDTYQQAEYRGADKSLRFESDVPPEMTAIDADKDLLRIALNNLLINAVKYTGQGGRIRLTAKETDNTIEIRVRDTGCGIAPEERQRIFSKFYRSTDSQIQKIGGHGLGLSLAKEIVELHGGSLTVASKVGVGSEFTIKLQKQKSMIGATV